MKTAIITTILGLSAMFASAAPADEMRKRDVVRRQTSASASISASISASASFSEFPSSSFIGTGSSFLPATGTGALFPTGTASMVNLFAANGLAGSVCSSNGELICNGPHEFGICNWGRVHFAPVAHGTTCQNGRIAFDRR